MKALIFTPYYNRPILIKNAMNSILKSNEYHQEWELIFGDDNSKIPGEPIVKDILKDHLDKVVFVCGDATFEDKVKNGLIMGKYANNFIEKTKADFGVMLSDDDELFPTYLRDLSNFYKNNPDVLYCYSNVHIYNPLFQKSENVDNLENKYNQWAGPINPVNKVDASQVSWRMSCCKEYGARFKDSTKGKNGMPWDTDTDKSFFESLYEKCGECHPTNFISQYKGIHDYQLVWNKKKTITQLKEYDEMCRKLGGVKF